MTRTLILEPLIAADGTRYEFASTIIGHSFNEHGQPIGPATDCLSVLLAACPYRTILGPNTGRPVIGGIWLVPRAPLPVPNFIVRAVCEEAAAGRAFLLAADDRQARDTAKRRICNLIGSTAGSA